jgi:hypothetical protein
VAAGSPHHLAGVLYLVAASGPVDAGGKMTEHKNKNKNKKKKNKGMTIFLNS